MDVINYTVQSISTRIKWITEVLEIDPKTVLPEIFSDVEAWENIALKLYSEANPTVQLELVVQCEVVGLNRLANDFLGALKTEQKLMYENSQQ